MPIKILLVEDQYHNIRLIEQILEEISDKIQITKAESGCKTIEVAKFNEFDIVLMDIALPDMDGIQLSNVLKTYPQFEKTPFIAVTAYAMLKDEEKFKEIFDDYISKPIDEEVFIDKMKKWIGDKIE